MVFEVFIWFNGFKKKGRQVIQAMRIYVHIKPNSSPSGVISESELPADKFGIISKSEKTVTALKVAVNSAPVDGKANEDLVKIISRYFDVPKSSISIIHGLKSRYKVLEIN